MKLITANKLNRFYAAIKNVFAAKTQVLTTTEQVKANTNSGNIASAVVTKELITKFCELNTKLGHGRIELVIMEKGSLGYRLDGADSVTPFFNIKYKTGQYTIAGSNTHTVNVDGEIIGVISLAMTGTSPTGGAWFRDVGYEANRLNVIRSVNDSAVTFGTWTSGLTFEYCICYKS